MNSPNIYLASFYLQWAGSVAVAIACLLFPKQRPVLIRILGLYAAVSVLLSLAQEVSRVMHYGVNWIGNVFTISEALVLSLVYLIATESKGLKRTVLVLTGLYTVVFFATYLVLGENFFSIIRFGRDFLMIILSLAYFYYLIKKLPEQKLLLLPMFWINASVIFFFSGTLILSWMRDYIVYHLNNDFSGFLTFKNFFRFAFCLVLAYAAWLEWRSNPNRPSNSTSSSSSSLS